MPPKPRAHLDLIGVFESEALRIINAAAEGTILHRTGNIRDSGEPVEAALRDLFARRLPAAFEVLSGYFYSEESNCSAQVDVMICRASEAHALGPGAHCREYVPFTSVHVVAEVKKSTYSVVNSFEQLRATTECWNAMLARSRELWPPPRQSLEQPLSIMFFANAEGVNIDDLKAFYASTGSKPDYAVFLDQARLIAFTHPLLDFADGGLSFSAHRYRGIPKLFGPPAGDRKAGRLLLWLYFAVATALNFTGGNMTSHVPFTVMAEKLYRLEEISPLFTATSL